MQGMRQPVTPMGMSLLMYGTADWFKAYGVAIDPEHPGLIADIAGGLFIDLTPCCATGGCGAGCRRRWGSTGRRSPPRSVGCSMTSVRGPTIVPSMDALIKIMMRALPDLVFNGGRAVIAPRRALIRVTRRLDDFRAIRGPDVADPAERIDWCVHGQTKVLAGMMDLLPPLWTSMIARGLGVACCRVWPSPARSNRPSGACHTT